MPAPTLSSHSGRRPPRGLPLLHLALALLAAAVLLLPVASLRDGSTATVLELVGPWAIASLILTAAVCAAATTLAITGGGDWRRLTLLDPAVLLTLVPAVIGLVLHWKTIGPDVASPGLAFWLALLLLLMRIPLTLYIRSGHLRASTANT